MININEVIIITGPTGCGKTTQIPQYILDSYAEKNLNCNIIVTQPRRIAAITTAKRVCEEREWPLSSICGYQVIKFNIKLLFHLFCFCFGELKTVYSCINPLFSNVMIIILAVFKSNKQKNKIRETTKSCENVKEFTAAVLLYFQSLMLILIVTLFLFNSL